MAADVREPVIDVIARPETVIFVAADTGPTCIESYIIPVLERAAAVSPLTKPVNDYVGVKVPGALVVPSYTLLTLVLVIVGVISLAVIVAATSFALAESE